MDNRNYLYSAYADGISHPNQFQQNENNFVKQEYQGPWENNVPYVPDSYYSGQNQFQPSGYGSVANNYYAYPTQYTQPTPEYHEYGTSNFVNTAGYPHSYGMGNTPYPGSVPINIMPNSFSVDQFASHYYPNTEYSYNRQAQVFNNSSYMSEPRETNSNFGKYKTSNKSSLAKPYTKSNNQEISLPPDPFYGNWSAIITPKDLDNGDSGVPETILNFERDDTLSEVGNALLQTQRVLCENLQGLTFDEPVAHVYSPAVYAFQTFKEFIRKYCKSEKKILFVGINPGPWGMVQSGVPFGERTFVCDWLEIQGHILKPAWEHPKRPILGLDCTRSEVSGKKLWTLIKNLCGHPENFFQHCFLHNICPLSFLSKTGSNITPPDILPAEKRNQLNQICDASLTDVIRLLKVEVVVAIGRYVETRVKNIMKNGNLPEFRVECLAHPSPLNRKAGNRWAEIAEEQLREFGVLSYFKKGNEVSEIKPEFTESQTSEQDLFIQSTNVGLSPSLKTCAAIEPLSGGRHSYSETAFVKQESSTSCIEQRSLSRSTFVKEEPIFDAPCTEQFSSSFTSILGQNPLPGACFGVQEPYTKTQLVESGLPCDGGSLEPGLASEFGIIDQNPMSETATSDQDSSSTHC